MSEIFWRDNQRLLGLMDLALCFEIWREVFDIEIQVDEYIRLEDILN
jgi:hypothetical protein